jgi:hypothetical protein
MKNSRFMDDGPKYMRLVSAVPGPKVNFDDLEEEEAVTEEADEDDDTEDDEDDE